MDADNTNDREEANATVTSECSCLIVSGRATPAGGYSEQFQIDPADLRWYRLGIVQRPDSSPTGAFYRSRSTWAIAFILVAVFLARVAFNMRQDRSSSPVMASIDAMLLGERRLLRDKIYVRLTPFSSDARIDRPLLTGECE